ncbi:MAG: hypothetical protein ABSE59_11910 [Opitutaceae bacterium]|jgi:hypothetical protein
MMKRNGELCEHTVPDYSGRLTDAEFIAYNSVFSAVENDLKELSTLTATLAEVEKSFAQYGNTAISSRNGAVEILEANGSEWEIIKPLLNVPGSEMLWCRRPNADEFAVVHRLDVNSPLARAQGPCSVQMSGVDVPSLLRNFLHEQRETLSLYALDIVAEAHERIAEKYPGQDMDRVARAIEARCAKKISGEQTTAPSQTQSRREGIRM